MEHQQNYSNIPIFLFRLYTRNFDYICKDYYENFFLNQKFKFYLSLISIIALNNKIS